MTERACASKDEFNSFAGMDVNEIIDFMDAAIKDVCAQMVGSEHFDKVHHLRWHMPQAIMGAHGDGLFKGIIGRHEVMAS